MSIYSKIQKFIKHLFLSIRIWKRTSRKNKASLEINTLLAKDVGIKTSELEANKSFVEFVDMSAN